jgi:neutral amino acid transport system permease protein
MSAVTTFVQAVFNGLVDGAAIALAALGLTLSYGISRFINFAYGEFLTLGAFVAVFLSGTGLPVPLAILAGSVIVGVLGVGINTGLYRPLQEYGPVPLLITSFGVAFVLRTTLRGIVGSQGYTFDIPLLRPIEVAGVFFPVLDLVILAVGAVVLVLVYLLLTKTVLGIKMRAISGDRDLARVSSIDVERIGSYTWFVSAGIGALAGGLLALRLQPFTPSLGWELLLVVFAATILGGIGRPLGATIGAVLIGLTMSLGTTYLSSSYTTGYAFVVLLGVILVRPEGILRGEI